MTHDTVSSRSHPLHHGLLAVDIEGSGRADRPDPVRADLQHQLRILLEVAVRETNIPVQSYRYLERGDGAALVFDATVPESRLVDDLVRAIRVGLRQRALLASETATIRLRIAVHAGQVVDGPSLSGADLNHVFRLVNSPALREGLAGTTGLYALCVSDSVFQAVVRHGWGLLDPGEFADVQVVDGETVWTAWLWVSNAKPPSRTATPSNRDRRQWVPGGGDHYEQHVSGNARAVQRAYLAVLGDHTIVNPGPADVDDGEARR